MQKVRDLDFFKNIRQVREYEFGIFYFFDGLVISEMKEGAIFDWSTAERVIATTFEVLGRDKPIAYISNRINNYSVVPTDWLKFYKHRHKLKYYSVVAYNKSGLTSLVLEKMFFRNKIRQFQDLQSAINWSLAQVSRPTNKVLPEPSE